MRLPPPPLGEGEGVVWATGVGRGGEPQPNSRTATESASQTRIAMLLPLNQAGWLIAHSVLTAADTPHAPLQRAAIHDGRCGDVGDAEAGEDEGGLGRAVVGFLS